jgi:hypothetical protein
MKIFKRILSNSTIRVVVFTLIFLFFFINGVLSLDPDFGWHLTSGNLTIVRGIAKTDPFSYTMPSFLFVDHEWLTNVLIAKAYPLIGKVGLSLICAFIATAAIQISVSDTFSSGRRYIALFFWRQAAGRILVTLGGTG